MTTDLKIPQIVQEECAEVIQAVSKILRFGLMQRHPETGMVNKTALEIEIGQLQYMFSKLFQEWQLDMDTIAGAAMQKSDTFEKWAQFNVDSVHDVKGTGSPQEDNRAVVAGA
jgi:hypothetical protein